MSTTGADFTHYQYRSTESSAPIQSLAEIVSERRAREAAAEAEREKLSEERHKKFLEGFRESIRRESRYTEEEKHKIITESLKW